MRIFALFAGLLAGCGSLQVANTDASQFEEAVGMPIDRTTGKPLLDSNARSPGLEATGPSTNGISANTAVWDGSNRWYNVSDEAGMAWAANSGLTWDEKYAAWIDAMDPIVSDDGTTTVEIITPDGRRVPSPRLECAEMAMFLRVVFAQWFDLPFFMTAHHPTYGALHFGHFGVVRDNGQRVPGYPNYATQYPDFTADGQVGSDPALASRKLTQLEDDYNIFLGENAYAGAYFDNLLANKRVGHFLHVLLTSFGSMHLAYSQNTFDLDPAAIREGDLLVHRWQRKGIGHVMVLKEVEDQGGNTSAQIMFGSMPRIQPAWYDDGMSRGYLLGEHGGSKKVAEDGVTYAELGGGLKRWRTPVVKGGRWMNIIPVRDRDHAIDGEDFSALGDRVDALAELLGGLTPEEQVQNTLGRIELARENLRRRPASCSNRIRREEAFRDLYTLMAEHYGQDQAQVDAAHRVLDDYVLSELDYDDSKTCCWNSTTPDMYTIIMDKAQEEISSEDTCIEPTVFKAIDGGYDIWADYAAATDRGSLWVAWSEDESCPQRNVQDDAIAPITHTAYCDIAATLPGAVDNTDACQGVTFEGECNGDQLRYCDNGTLHQADCGTCGWDSGNSFYNCL